jgi:hypothetical protein
VIRLLRLRLRLLGHRRDEGMALVAVIGIGAVLMLVSATMLAVSVSGLQKSDESADWNASIAAAYAGIDDYQSRLAADSTYTKYGNPTATFSAGSKFTGDDANPAFGVGTSGKWAPVDEAGTATYRYEVDNSKYADTGALRLRSTGRVGNTTRSVVAELKQQGFIDFLYFTNYEIVDPDFSNSSCTPSWAWDTGRDSDCQEIQFLSKDKIDGPLHSNDTLYICGGEFTGRVTTPYEPKTGKAYKTVSGCSTPIFRATDSPGYGPVIPMPQTNLEMIQETRSDLRDSTVPRPGCLYTGPTTNEYDGLGFMTVRSPWTIATNITGTSPVTGGSVSTECGTPGRGTGQSGTLGSPNGQKIKVPENNLVYVQDVTMVPLPALTPDPNDWRSGTTPTGLTCRSADNTQAGNGVGYPVAGEVPPSSSSYDCYAGDVFVKGTVHATTTLAAKRYVYVVGDVKYQDADADMLGLVGNNAVIVHNPKKRKTNSTAFELIDTSQSDRRIDAAILSLEHTFYVQNHDLGRKGTLIVNGAIAQKYRGLVGTGTQTSITTGYAKLYTYDDRMRYTAPPKFLSPVSTTYGITRVNEAKTAFDAKGAKTP